MADFGAVLLILAAIGAVILRVVAATSAVAATPPGNPRPAVWTGQNKFVTFGAVTAIVIAVLLLISPIGGWAAVIPFLLCLVMVVVLICMAVTWPENNIGDVIFDNIWGQPVYETDPAEDDRLDPMSMNYDPAMDSNDPAYDEDYFKSSAIVKERGRPYGVLTYFGAAAATFLYVILAWVIIALSGLSLGSMGGDPSNPTAQPTAEATTSAPTPAPTSATPSGKPKVSGSSTVSGTCAELVAWVPKLNNPEQESFYPGGVFRCSGNGTWKSWTGEAPGFVVVTRAFEFEGYNYYVFNWKGEDVLIRVQVKEK